MIHFEYMQNLNFGWSIHFAVFTATGGSIKSRRVGIGQLQTFLGPEMQILAIEQSVLRILLAVQ